MTLQVQGITMHKVVEVLAVLGGSVALFVIWLLMHRRDTRLAACHWRGRPPMGDDDFSKLCEIPDEPLRISVALAARRVIGELGTVPAETIYPDDTFAHDLVQLPYWDSLDWLDFIFRVERESQRKLPRSALDVAAMSSGGRDADLRVKHVVRAIAMAAMTAPGTP
jgi:hypothetical protein